MTDGLELTISYSLSTPLPNGAWEYCYLVDSVRNRHVIKLGRLEEEDLERGENESFFEVDSIDVSGIKKGALTNAGLLSAALLSRRDNESEPVEVFKLNFVVQVREVGGEFVRTIFNPLE